MKKEPLVSVIMPVYNGGEFIAEAIESILSQTYKNLELIVVDDGSKDNTAEIIRSCRKGLPNTIHPIFLEKNTGESAAANIGFKQAQGEFIARMDADDISHPERLKAQIEFMGLHPEVIVLGTQAQVINANGEVIGKKTFPTTHKEIYNSYAIVHPMLHPSCMFRRSLLPNKEKLYEGKLEPNDDYYTLFNLLNYGKFANLEEYLLSYRVHSTNKSLRYPKTSFANILKIRRAAVRELNYKPTHKALVLNFLQYIIVGILPEKLVVPTYMLLRGMHKPFARLRKVSLRWSF